MKRYDIDGLGEKLLRKFAGNSSRRSFLTKLGATIVAAPAFPLLPVSRASAATKDRSPEAKTAFARNAQTKDDTKCDYWRYCAIDGSLCSCCGGGMSICPPGAEPSPVSCAKPPIFAPWFRARMACEDSEPKLIAEIFNTEAL